MPFARYPVQSRWSIFAWDVIGSVFLQYGVLRIVLYTSSVVFTLVRNPNPLPPLAPSSAAQARRIGRHVFLVPASWSCSC